MARCILLNFDGTRIALRENNFVKESLNYNFSGEVTKFQLSKGDRKSYLYTIHENDQSKFYGFLELGNYTSIRAQRDADKNVTFTKEQWSKGELTLNRIADFQLEKAQAGDTIIGCFGEVSGNKMCKRYYQITYEGTIPDKNTFKQQGTKIEGEQGLIDCTTFDPEKQSGKFFSAYKNHTFFDAPNSPTYTDPELILEISNLIDSIDKTIFDAWQEFLTNPYSTENFFKLYDPNEPLPPSFYNRSHFISYRDGLRRWLKLLKERQEDLKHLKKLPHGDLLMLLFIMDRENMLGRLPVQIKIDALAAIVADYWVTEFFFSFNFGQMQLFDRENLVMAIVNSVSAEQATEFIQKLEATIVTVDVDDPDLQLTYSYSKNLYIRLFSAIDDYGGENNFTKLIFKINQLFSIKLQLQTIIDDHPAGFTAGDLEALKNNGTIKHSFIWKENGVLGRTSFKARINDIGDKLTITESICNSTKAVRNFMNGGDGPAAVWYTEECDGYTTNTFNNISHFSLVYVHFYNHPYFIDLRTNPNYEGKGFFTFAGFFYYLQIKEKTYWTETIFNICLTALSVFSPLGEVMLALRGANYVYAVLNIASLVGNTSMFLTSNTQFTNYLIQKYPNDYNDIIMVLNIMGVFAVLNANQPNLDLVKVLPNRISKLEAAKYLGTARELAKDVDLAATLGASEMAQFRQMVLKFESELFKYGDIPEIYEQIKANGSIVKYYKNAELRTEILQLSPSNKTLFLQTFEPLDDIYLVYMHEFPYYVDKWKNLSAEQKVIVKRNPMAAIESESLFLRFKRSYTQPPKVPIDNLTNAYLQQKYGPFAVTLKNNVRARASEIRNDITINPADNYDGLASVAQYYDKESGIFSEAMTAFTITDVKIGYLRAIVTNSGPGANTSRPFMNPNVNRLLIQQFDNLPLWNGGLSLGDNKVLFSYMRHPDVRAFNDLACKRFGNTMQPQAVFDKWCRENVFYFQELLRESKVNGISMKIVHDPCKVCFYPTFFVNLIR